MFLVRDHRHDLTSLVFTGHDPRADGYRGELEEGVKLSYDMDVHHWPAGEPRPEISVGRSRQDPKSYRVFKFRNELEPAGYDPVAGVVVQEPTWNRYLRHEAQEDLPAEDWLDELDRYDEAARRRRDREEAPDEPASAGRDDVAAWVAKTHLVSDPTVREVWYLPREAPPDEIRLMELSDRLELPLEKAKAVDFGLRVQGANFRLMVADVSTAQFRKFQADPSRLPDGWSLADGRKWERRSR